MSIASRSSDDVVQSTEQRNGSRALAKRSKLQAAVQKAGQRCYCAVSTLKDEKDDVPSEMGEP